MGLFDRLFSAPQPPTSSPAFAVVDVETTGLSPRNDRVVEIAVVHVSSSGQRLGEWTTRLNPEGPVGATHIHGITDADVQGKPVFRDTAATVASVMSGLPIVAHNAKFDLAFLRAEFSRAGWDMPWMPSFCTLDGSYAFLPNLDRRRLTDCCWAAGVQYDNAHSALHDARATAGLLSTYISRAERSRFAQEFAGLSRDARSVAWPTQASREPSAWSPAPRSAGFRRQAPRPAQPALIAQLSGLSLAEVVDEGAPEGTAAYLETLLAAVEDGEISESEAEELVYLAGVYELSNDDIRSANEAFVLALAHRAVDDGHVSQAERAELRSIADLIGVDQQKIVDLISRADKAKDARQSAGLSELPAEWALGDPLRVGDKIAFTGGEEMRRARLEGLAEKLGVRVMNNVSRLTRMLVADGDFRGGKITKAEELGTRIVTTAEFETLLAHLQPALENPPTASPSGAIPESLDLAGASPSQVRTWAIANGFEVGVRGRLPIEVLQAYAAATSAAS